MIFLRLVAAAALLSALNAQAAEQSSAVASAASFFQVLMGLLVVLGLMAAIAWSLKRLNIAKVAGNAPVKVVGGVSVGNRERVIVVEVADQWIVVGVATGQVTALSTMARPQNLPPSSSQDTALPMNQFAVWLKQKIEKRNGGQ
jgi:flagellar protein FliO/FliZ